MTVYFNSRPFGGSSTKTVKQVVNEMDGTLFRAATTDLDQTDNVGTVGFVLKSQWLII